jgi:hypothetical protein
MKKGPATFYLPSCVSPVCRDICCVPIHTNSLPTPGATSAATSVQNFTHFLQVQFDSNSPGPRHVPLPSCPFASLARESCEIHGILWEPILHTAHSQSAGCNVCGLTLGQGGQLQDYFRRLLRRSRGLEQK